MDGTTVNQKFAYLFGAVYILVGLLGFAVTTDTGFADAQGASLLGFDVNPLHNIAHIILGGAFLIGARGGPVASRAVNSSMGLLFLVLALIGVLIDTESSANILALNAADNWLHLITGVAALAVAMYGGRESSTNRGRPASGM